MCPTLSICVPVYNEVDNLPLLHEARLVTSWAASTRSL